MDTFLKVLFGVLLKHIWEKYRGRMTYIHYTINTRSIGRSVSDRVFGDVSVTYNGKAYSNLYFCTVTIENRSNKDLTNIDINIYGDDENTILMSQGFLAGSPNSLKFTDSYGQKLERAPTDSTLLPMVMGRRDYVIPVFNRGSTVSIQFLGTSPKETPPIVASCDHPGVKLKFAKELPHFKGEPSNYCAWLGSIITLFLCYPLITYLPIERSSVGIVVAALLGIFAMGLGWLAMKAIRIIFRIVG